jgi:putative transposase
MDFFAVPTLTFGILYCFFVVGHHRRKILRFNVTRNPNAFWIVQQMREAWPYVPAHRFLLSDRDSKFGSDVISAERLGKPTSPHCLSQSVAERCRGALDRELLDHVIVPNEQHLQGADVRVCSLLP